MSRYVHDREVLTRADGMPIDFTPNAHRNIKVSPDYWERMLRFQPVGIAPGTESTSDGTPTVRCTYADGTSEVRTVSSFSKVREARRAKRLQARKITEVERYGLTNNIGLDYS